ncbi:MAG: hypothetical protein NTNFB02_23390 [Nitrospira sp.]
MVERILYSLILVELIVMIGCTHPKESETRKDSPESMPPAHVAPKDTHKKAPKQPDSEVSECKELVKNLNSPLAIAVRVALGKYSGTAVQADEMKKTDRIFYRVLVQGDSGRPKSFDVTQETIEGEKLVEPPSSPECKSLYAVKQPSIVIAIHLAQKHLNGRAQNAVLMAYGQNDIYSVGVTDSSGQSHNVFVDADEKKIIKDELITR